MTASDLHEQFFNFAGGMPAVAVSTDILELEVVALQESLEGNFPDKPSNICGNIKLGLYGLAYSVFVDNISFVVSGGKASLSADLRATMHPDGKPDEIIRLYEVSTNSPQQLALDHDINTKQMFWRANGLSVPDIVPSWGTDYEAILDTTSMADPKPDTYLNEIEPQALSNGQNTFFNLIIDLLPRIDLREIIPWVNFLEPIRVSYEDNHILLTSPLALMEIGGCTPKTIQIQPEPDFPYGLPAPVATYPAREVDYAIYFPQTRLVNFAAELIQPAILVDSGRRGGLIKWQATGAIGLKEFKANISGGIAKGFDKLYTTLGVNAVTSFVGAARAWIDGPSGLKIGLASASVTGQGEFSSRIEIAVNLRARVVEADLIVERAHLRDIDFDVSLLWPINEVIGEIVRQIATDEVRKLSGTVSKLGRWDFFGIPNSYLEILRQFSSLKTFPYYEGAEGLSGIVGIVSRFENSEIPTTDEEPPADISLE